MSVADRYTCGIRRHGTLECWGNTEVKLWLAE